MVRRRNTVAVLIIAAAGHSSSCGPLFSPLQPSSITLDASSTSHGRGSREKSVQRRNRLVGRRVSSKSDRHLSGDFIIWAITATRPSDCGDAGRAGPLLAVRQYRLSRKQAMCSRPHYVNSWLKSDPSDGRVRWSVYDPEQTCPC